MTSLPRILSALKAELERQQEEPHSEVRCKAIAADVVLVDGYIDLTALASAVSTALTADMPAWQPVETAPKDGAEILVTDGKSVGLAKWAAVSMSGSLGWCVAVVPGADWNYYEEFYCATHWMPLPKPPVQS